MTAAEIAAESGIPEQVIVEKFGLRGKHIAAPDEHVSDLSVAAAQRAARRDRDGSGLDRRRHLLRLDVARLPGVAGGAAHRRPARREERVRDRVRQRLARDADRAARRARPAAGGGGAADDPRRRRLPRVVPARLRERALALHVQLRRRRGRRARRRRRRTQRDPRLARDHRRLVLAAGEGAGRRLGRPRRLPVPRRRRSAVDEGRPRRGVAAELRRTRRTARSSVPGCAPTRSPSSARCTRSARCSLRCSPRSECAKIRRCTSTTPGT